MTTMFDSTPDPGIWRKAGMVHLCANEPVPLARLVCPDHGYVDMTEGGNCAVCHCHADVVHDQPLSALVAVTPWHSSYLEAHA